jgi:hypothetical protein
LHNALWVLVTFGLRLEEVAKERALAIVDRRAATRTHRRPQPACRSTDEIYGDQRGAIGSFRGTPPRRSHICRHPLEEREPMPAFTLIPADPDPVDRSHSIDLAGAGLAGYCAAATIGADGCEHLALLAYNSGPADHWPLDWTAVAPHEVLLDQLPLYWKDA